MQPKYFVRDATGLVREFGAVDVLLFASAMVFALVFTTTQFAWFYGNTGGANLPLSLLVAAIPFAFLMIGYWAIGLVMPRTGSDYVWVSRILHPSIGFAWGLLYMLTVFLVAYVGEITSFSFAFSITLTSSGAASQTQSLVNLGNFLSGAQGTFILAIIFTVVFGIFSVFGTRYVKGVIYVSWIAAIIGMIVMWYILSTANPAVFATKWDKFGTLTGATGPNATYAGLQQQSVNFGWPGLTGGLSAIVIALPLASLFLFGGNYVNAFAGEIKNVRKTVPIALFLSLIFGIIYWSITSSLTLNAVGQSWISAVGYNWLNNPKFGLPYPPSQPLMLAVIAYPNVPLIYLMSFTYILGSIAPLFAYFWIPSKYFFAWSFDRIVPTRFADVSQRYHTPYYSILAMVVLGIVLSYPYAYYGWGTLFSIGTVIWGVSYIIPGLALVVFPFVKKDLFQKAPGWVSRKIAGIPIISIVGALTAIGFAYIGYIAYGNAAVGVPTQFAFELVGGIVIIGFIIYFASRAYQKGKGVNIDLAFKEIPPE